MPSASAIVAGQAAYLLSVDDTMLTRGLKAAEAKVRRAAQAVKEAGKAALVGGLGLGAALAPGTAVFVRFDDAIRAAGAKAEATAEQFDMLRAKALELGKTSGFSAAEVANLMTELATAGFKPDQINEATASILALARATGTDAAEAAKIAGAAINQFGLSAADAGHVADVLTAADLGAAVGVRDLGEALSYAGVNAKRAGVSLEDTLAILGTLGGAGVRGSEAGTALRRLLTLTAADAEKLRATFGVAAQDAAGNLRPLVDILSEVQQSMAGLGNVEQARRLNEFFGLLGITAAGVIGDNVKGFRELREEIENAGGRAAKTAAEMDAGVGGAWRRFKGAAEGAAVALGDAMAPALLVVGKALTGAMDAVAGFLRENKVLGTVLVVGAVGLVAFGAAATAVGLALTGVAAAAGLVAGAIGFLLSPVGLVTAAVAGLTVAFFTLTDVGKAIGETLRETFSGVIAAFKKGDLQLALDIAVSGLKVAWLQFVEFLRASWYSFANFFDDVFSDAVLGVQKMFLNVVRAIRTGFLDAIIFIIDRANAAHAAVTGQGGGRDDAVKRLGAPVGGKNSPFMENELAIVRARERLKREREKFASVFDEGRGLTPVNQETLATLSQNITEFEADLKRLEAAKEKMIDKEMAGGKWIDTAPFEQAREEISKEVDAAIRELDRLEKAERDARDKRQAGRLADIAAEREAMQARLKMLIDQANAAEPGPVAVAPMPRDVHLAPMPHLPGGAAIPQIGTAARGLFQSADFRGALSLGPVSDAARQQVDLLKNAVGVLKDGNGKLDVIASKLDNVGKAFG